MDNIILDKETGKIFCALDEVGEMFGDKFKEKRNRVLKKDEYGGVKLKYGLEVDKNKKIILVIEKVSHIPIFYLSLSKKMIDEGIENIISFEEKTKTEENLYKYFITLIKQQLKEGDFSSLKEQIETLDKFLEKEINSFEKK
ncbi:MAG: hypothetical protein ABH971_02940 [bacterium]